MNVAETRSTLSVDNVLAEKTDTSEGGVDDVLTCPRDRAFTELQR